MVSPEAVLRKSAPARGKPVPQGTSLMPTVGPTRPGDGSWIWRRCCGAFAHWKICPRLPRHWVTSRCGIRFRAVNQPAVVVGRSGEFAWYAIAGPRAELRARALGRSMAARGRLCGVLGLDPSRRWLAVTVSLEGAPSLGVALDEPERAALASLARLAVQGKPGAARYATHVADALGGEPVGRRFFREFRCTLERMAAGLPGALPGADRHAIALLQLTRVLFLYFVQAKGWLAGNERFLATWVDRCLEKRRRLHRDLLQPLFFGTLNRPAAERGAHRHPVRRGSLPQRRAVRTAPARAAPPRRHSQSALARRVRPAVRAVPLHRR